MLMNMKELLKVADKKESRYRNIFKIPNQNNTFNKTR